MSHRIVRFSSQTLKYRGPHSRFFLPIPYSLSAHIAEIFLTLAMSSALPDDDFDDDLDDDLDDDDDNDVISTPAPAPTTTPPVPVPTSTAALPGAQTTALQTASTKTRSGSTLSTATSGSNGEGANANTASTALRTTVYTTTSGGDVFTITTAQSALLPNSGASNQGNSSGLSTGAKAGIAIGVVVPLLLIAAGVAWLFLRRRKKKRLQSKSGGWTGSTYMGGAEKRTPGSLDESCLSPKSTSDGYEGMPELHDKDRHYEAPAIPVYEMAAASPAELEGEPPLQQPQQRGISASSPTQSPSEGTYTSVSPLSPRSADRSDANVSPVGTVIHTVNDSHDPSMSPDATTSASNISRKPVRPA